MKGDDCLHLGKAIIFLDEEDNDTIAVILDHKHHSVFRININDIYEL